MTIRFAIWTAVSTKKQASDDKASLTVQETKSRELGLSKGWLETAGPFVIPGESRSFYVNLSDAEKEISFIDSAGNPTYPLRDMLDAAQAGRFDVLIFYSYDRLGDLANMVAQTLRFYGVQLLSVSQGVDPQPPESFDPYTSDAEANMRIMSQLTQQFRIADMRRKYRGGMEKRITEGLHSHRIPYGYRRPATQETDLKLIRRIIPVPDQNAHIVTEIKDLFLKGLSYYEIARALNEKNYTSPEGAAWSHPTIKKIIANPYYAGKVFFGRYRTIRDTRLSKKTRIVTNPNPTLTDGKHIPLYSWETYLAIQDEIKRRESLPHNNRHAFSALLSCSICGKNLLHNKGAWRCKFHVSLDDDFANAIIPPALQKALLDVNPAPHTPPAPVSVKDKLATLKDLARQRRRIQEGYESGIYNATEAEAKIKKIDTQVRELKEESELTAHKQIARQQFINTIEAARKTLKDLPKYIRATDPKKANLQLHRLFRTVIISPDFTITPHLHE